MTNRHDERQWDDNDDAMTETDSDITRGYNAGTRDYDSITRSYKREREGVELILTTMIQLEVITNDYEDITKGYNE